MQALIAKSFILVMLLGAATMQSLHAFDSKTIVVYGASGRIGQVLVDVALERGHKVKGVSRDPSRLDVRHNNFTAVRGDMSDINSIRELASDADAIVISISAKASDNRPENSLLVSATKNVLAALSSLDKKPYLLQMGGANLMYGSTYEEVSKNMTNATFPFEEGTTMHAVLFGHQISLDMYRESDLDWSVIAPPMKILGIYGELDKTSGRGSWRTSTSGPLIDEQGNKTIYVRDLVSAMLIEIEKKEYKRQLFTVGY